MNKENNNNEILFTDKYKPTKYIDLITEEKTDREILTWMKSWDEIVFNKKFNIPKIPINLNKNSQLSGSIPPEIGNLSQLEEL